LLGVEGAFVASEPLYDYARIFVNQYAHSIYAARK
jgi:hypothetical protein